MKKTNVLGVVAAVLIVAVLVSLISWFLIKPVPTIIQGTTEATGYKASSKIAGRIDKMLIIEGQKVSKGELLYILSTPEMDAKVRQARAAASAAMAQDEKALAGARIEQIQAAESQLRQAEAGLALAQKSYDRVSSLYKDGVLPEQKYDEAEANLKSMKATVAAAKAQYEIALTATRKEDKKAASALVEQASGAVSEVESYAADAYIYSPTDGEVSSVIAEEGELIGGGYPVVSILDMDDIWVSFNIKEDLMPKIKMGGKLKAHFPALDKNLELEIYQIASQADFATWSATRTQGGFDIRTFNVKARPVTKDNDLRPGMTAVVNWDKM